MRGACGGGLGLVSYERVQGRVRWRCRRGLRKDEDSEGNVVYGWKYVVINPGPCQCGIMLGFIGPSTGCGINTSYVNDRKSTSGANLCRAELLYRCPSCTVHYKLSNPFPAFRANDYSSPFTGL